MKYMKKLDLADDVLPASVDTGKDYRVYIWKELVDSERVYIANLERFLWFRSEMTCPDKAPDLRKHVPMTLKKQSHILFSNADDILAFHTAIFLPELEHCESRPASLAKVFLDWDQELTRLYCIYAQFSRAGNYITDQVGSCKFLDKATKKLGKPELSLQSYLIVPMQRITGKYELLLQDMLKHTLDLKSRDDLVEAISSIQMVTKTVNSVQFCPVVVDYPGQMYQLGKLLKQGEFNLTVRKRGGKRKPGFVKRHVLLFELAMVICREYASYHRDAVPAFMRIMSGKRSRTNQMNFGSFTSSSHQQSQYKFEKKFSVGQYSLVHPGIDRKSCKIYHMNGPDTCVKRKWAEEINNVTTL